MCKLIMSDKYPQFCDELTKAGQRITACDKIDAFSEPEQKHADMQILRIKDKIFILNECVDLKNKLSDKSLIFCKHNVKKNYPENILLNCLFINNKLFAKLDSTDENVLKYCKNNNIEAVNVNQGYTRCSTLAVNDKAAITSDKSIEKALKSNGVEVLLISAGSIVLEGYNYGFIGGASVVIEDTVYFFGNIKAHPDFEKIKEFCLKHNSKLEILCENMPLTDIGGAVKTE